jgi:hypothetical protein
MEREEGEERWREEETEAKRQNRVNKPVTRNSRRWALMSVAASNIPTALATSGNHLAQRMLFSIQSSIQLHAKWIRLALS